MAQKNRVLDVKVSCSCKEIADKILLMCTAIGIKPAPTDISDVSNSKYRRTMQSVDEALHINTTNYISLTNLIKQFPAQNITIIKMLSAISS